MTGTFDIDAFIIFIIMVFWQMVHFYAIAIRRSKDYKAAGIPVLPLVKGVRETKIHMIMYTIGFSSAAIALSIRLLPDTHLGSHGYFRRSLGSIKA